MLSLLINAILLPCALQRWSSFIGLVMLPKEFMVFSDHVCLIGLCCLINGYFGGGWGNLRGKDSTTDIRLIPFYIQVK